MSENFLTPAITRGSAPSGDAEAISIAGERIHAYQKRSTFLFSVSVDILNASRLLDSMGFDLRLLALNGMVQAAHLGDVQGRQGDALLTLARILSDSPRTMSPLIQALGGHCRSIAGHTASCSSLARRYLQHFRALAIVLGNQCPPEQKTRFASILLKTNLLREYELKGILDVFADWELSSQMRANLLLLVRRCAGALHEMAAQFTEVRHDLSEARLVLGMIERCADTVNYLGVNVAIEAAHLAQAGENFRQLAVDIENTLEIFAERLEGIHKSARRGESVLTEVGAWKQHA